MPHLVFRSLAVLLLPILSACSLDHALATAGAVLNEADKALQSEPPVTPSGSPPTEPSATPSATPSVLAPEVAPASVEERRLYDLLMVYRAEKGLPAIPFSRSLTQVARLHVADLEKHPREPDCNLHSWSDDGPWKGMCYTRDHAQGSLMWSKPKELTSYQGNGYEISYMAGRTATPESALKAWQGSSGHNAVIINGVGWERSTWQAVGVGIQQHYAVVWFGKEADPAGNL